MATIIPIDEHKQLRFESCEFGDRPETYIKTTYSVETITSHGIVVERMVTFPAEADTVTAWESQLGETIREALHTAILEHYNSI